MLIDKNAAQLNGQPPQDNTDVGNKAATPSQTRHSYLPGIDGLRAIAVMAVLFYHAEMTWMPGGFLGVEVFFVISGYLITGLLVAEWRRTGGINLGRFWFRRARRLLPAVFALLIAVLAFAVIFLPAEVASLRYDALAAAFYVSNWFQIFSHKSYFETIGRPSLLRHLWSLAVEEQFYLVWPVLLALYLRFGLPLIKPRRLGDMGEAAQRENGSQYRGALALFALAGAVASALLMAAFYNPDVDPSRIYYGTDTRAAGFLIGAALGMLLPAIQSEQSTSSRFGWLLDGVGFISLAGLMSIFVFVSEINPYLYLGGFAMVALLTAAGIFATVRNGSHIYTRLLSLPVIRWIGLRSYSIYLWHWPIFTVTRPALDIQLGGLPLMLLRLALTAICAELSYRFIERPIREGAIGRVWNRLRQAPPVRVRLQWAGIGAISVVLLLALGVAVVRAQPPAVPEEYAEAGDAIAMPIAPTEEALVTPLPAPLVQTPTAAPAKPMTATQASPASKPTRTVTAAYTQTPAVAAAPTGTVVPVSTAVAAITSTIATITDTTTLTDVLGENYHITAIGDSVMKGAVTEMRQAMGDIEVDAVVGRQAGAALTDLRRRHDAGTLGNLVIVHIGNNGFITQKQMDDIMQVLSDVPRVIFLNVHVPLRWEGPNNTLIADAVSKASNATLVDWHGITGNRPELFTADGVHLQIKTRTLYARLIVDQIKAPYLAQRNTPGALQQRQ